MTSEPFLRQVTKRELEILKLCAEGWTDYDIGAQLSISYKTVAHHLDNIRTRLDAKNRPHLVAIAFRRRLIE